MVKSSTKWLDAEESIFGLGTRSSYGAEMLADLSMSEVLSRSSFRNKDAAGTGRP